MSTPDPYGDRAWLAAQKARLAREARPGRAGAVERWRADEGRAFRGMQSLCGRTWNGKAFEP